MNKRKYRYFVGDFETTVYEGQDYTEVWSSASAELFTEDVKVFHSIEEQFEYFKSLNTNLICYYHNLKFDGNFWLSYIMTKLKLTQAETHNEDDINSFRFLDEKEMPDRTFTYAISNMGQWYRITIKINGKIIEFRDSMKLLPFSVASIGKSFKTKHQKLEMEYKGFRYAGCNITDEEMAYIKNDILVMKEAMELLFMEGHTKLTIGSCCLAEFKKTISKYDEYFPNLYKIKAPAYTGCENVGEYIRKSYRGGWCYVVKGKEGKIYKNGLTADVNSLYPSMMSSESGNRFPVGLPYFWKGNFIPDEAIAENKYYFVRLKTRFYIKKNKLPFIQGKGNLLYTPTEMLETSDVYNKKDKKYHKFYTTIEGEVKPTIMTMIMTMTDYILFREHYNVKEFEILDGCWFYSEIGIFDKYIEKYKKIKLESTGARRELAKLFLNNLYGKMASNTNSDFKVAYIREDKSIGFYEVQANEKEPGYIPIGSAITSYARNFTIRRAQMNYYGKDKAGFIYADTDSIHCDLKPEELVGITVHPKNFCCWKLEKSWDEAIFVRQKTYMEHIIAEDLVPVEKPYNLIKCAGMPEKCKDLLNKSMTNYEVQEGDNFTDEELKFVSEHRTMKDFKRGLLVPGKLLPKRIQGGVVLMDVPYEMR